jgi:hypothetical protein
VDEAGCGVDWEEEALLVKGGQTGERQLLITEVLAKLSSQNGDKGVGLLTEHRTDGATVGVREVDAVEDLKLQHGAAGFHGCGGGGGE